MFKNLNEKDKKKIYSLLSLGVICVIALIVISCIPESGKSSENQEGAQVAKQEKSEQNSSNQELNLEARLQEILSEINGAGNVKVMLTYDSSEELEPAFNSNSTTETTEEKDAQGGERKVTTESENKTMITSGTNSPMILKTNEAKVKGVLVVASGATDPKVKQTLYEAVQTALQVEGHQVKIIEK
ncbi:MAG: stage III sporulation protein AG [Peptostreptococcaceae bacterium]